jgi:hypothetical protein
VGRLVPIWALLERMHKFMRRQEADTRGGAGRLDAGRGRPAYPGRREEGRMDNGGGMYFPAIRAHRLAIILMIWGIGVFLFLFFCFYCVFVLFFFPIPSRFPKPSRFPPSRFSRASASASRAMACRSRLYVCIHLVQRRVDTYTRGDFVEKWLSLIINRIFRFWRVVFGSFKSFQ